jgi:acetyl-CoA/propionyl-CoA carboxylase biotin carboxyl carrier protein
VRRRAFDWAVEGAAEGVAAMEGGGGSVVWIGDRGRAWRLVAEPRVRIGAAAAAHGAGRVTSPMPGTVLAVRVAPGQAVTAGEELVVVEAMKMEHTVRAGEEGTVTEVLVKAGDSVRLEQPLVVLDGKAESGGGA